MAETENAPRTQPGAQTLARGITALKAVAATPDGLSTQEVADRLGVHRTIAHRLLGTLAGADLVQRGDDGRFRGAAGLLALAAGAYSSFRERALPIMRAVADEAGATVSLVVPQGDEAVALAVVEPRSARYHLTFAEGSRHPLSRGAAGLALLAQLPQHPQAAAVTEAVARVRELGHAETFAEIEPGAFGIAVPCPVPGIVACLNLITSREEVAHGSIDSMLAAARRISAAAA